MSKSVCVAFDQYSVQRKLSNKPEAFLKFCHHGLIETVIPLFIEDKLSGAIFIGPFIWDSQTLPPDVFKAGKKIDNLLLESQKTVLPKIRLRIQQ
jgi:ligand-binding sensor protein